jgi:hypothetical protein
MLLRGWLPGTPFTDGDSSPFRVVVIRRHFHLRLPDIVPTFGRFGQNIDRMVCGEGRMRSDWREAALHALQKHAASGRLQVRKPEGGRAGGSEGRTGGKMGGFEKSGLRRRNSLDHLIFRIIPEICSAPSANREREKKSIRPFAGLLQTARSCGASSHRTRSSGTGGSLSAG